MSEEKRTRTSSNSVIETENVNLDKRKFVDEYVKPLADKIGARCYLYNIPFVFCCAKYDSDKETIYDGNITPPAVMYNDKEHLSLTYDIFKEYFYEMIGYDKNYAEIDPSLL